MTLRTRSGHKIDDALAHEAFGTLDSEHVEALRPFTNIGAESSGEVQRIRQFALRSRLPNRFASADSRHRLAKTTWASPLASRVIG